MLNFSIRLLLPGLLAAALAAGCASSSHRAPVEQRPVTGTTPGSLPPADAAGTTQASTSGPSPSGDTPAVPAVPPLPGAENAGKPGYYTVRPGDTLIRIGLETGQNWRDIARWNAIDRPNTLEVGQVLRVVPPAPVATTQPVAAAPRVESRPLDAKSPTTGAGSAPSAPTAPTATPVPAAAPAATAGTPSPRSSDPDEDIAWMWPAAGAVVTPFDEAKNKGLSITGKAGDPVFAAADGRVVYAGSGLRGYGNLVIVKHNNTYLTAYAHNQTLLVKDDQIVRRGQKIAEMGSSESDRVQLHFEIRRQGKPVDPTRLLPPR